MININEPVGYIEFIDNRRVDVLRTCRTVNGIKVETVDGIYIYEPHIKLNRLYDSEGKELNDFVKFVLYR